MKMHEDVKVVHAYQKANLCANPLGKAKINNMQGLIL